MTYWIASGNRNNWEIVKKEKIWGIPKRSKKLFSRVKVGDNILLYVRSEVHGREILPSAFVGVFKIIELFEDDTPLFTAPPHMGNEIFPFRFRLNTVKIFHQPVEIKPLIPNLGFITNKIMWSGHFRQAMREIPEEDYQIILK